MSPNKTIRTIKFGFTMVIDSEIDVIMRYSRNLADGEFHFLGILAKGVLLIGIFRVEIFDWLQSISLGL